MTEKEVMISYDQGVQNEEGFFVLPGPLWNVITDTINADGTRESECIFRLSKEGLEINLVDYHSTMYTNIRLEADAFLEYGIKEPCEVLITDLTYSRKHSDPYDDVRISWTKVEEYRADYPAENITGKMCRTVGMFISSTEKGSESYFEQVCPFDPGDAHMFSPPPERFAKLRGEFDTMEKQCTFQIRISPLLRELKELEHPHYTTGALFMARHGHGTLHIYTTGKNPDRWVRRAEIATDDAIYSSGTVDTDMVTSTINPDRLIPLLSPWDEDSYAEITIGNNYPIRVQIPNINGYTGNSVTAYIAPKIGEIIPKRRQ